MIEELIKYFENCPHLKGGKINNDYLSNENDEYSIETIPSNPVVQRYIDGTYLKQFTFVFATRKSYGQEVVQNLLNSKFGQDLVDWIENNNEKGIYPEIDGFEKLEVLSTPYAYQTDLKSARYQIQLRVLYENKYKNEKEEK